MVFFAVISMLGTPKRGRSVLAFSAVINMLKTNYRPPIKNRGSCLIML